MKKLNLWSSVKARDTLSINSLEEVLLMIKLPSRDKVQLINTLRSIGKESELYDNIKVTLPAVTWNFEFNNQRRDDRIISSTGLFYLDFDCKNKTEANKLKVSLKKNPFIHSCWLSLSELGVGALIKVSGITKWNFSEAYKKAMEQFNLSYDKFAVKKTQPNILSYDPDIWVNLNSNIWKWPPTIVNIQLNTEASLKRKAHINKLREEIQCNISEGLKFKLELDNYTQDCHYFKEGKPFFEVFWPFVSEGKRMIIKAGRRHVVLSSFINNLVLLNQNPKFKTTLLNLVQGYNTNYVSPSFTQEEVLNLFNSKWEGRAKLNAVRVTNKYYWVNPKSSEKSKAYNQMRKNLTRFKLEEWMGDELLNSTVKITQKIVAEQTGLNVRTVSRYWSHYKDSIDEFNRNLLEADTTI